MNILLLGGSGFIGTWVARQLIAQGHEVMIFHRGQTTAILPDAVKYVYSDRCDLETMKPVLEAIAPHVVIDFFAYTKHDSQALVRAFTGIAQRLVILSSMDVYRAYNGLKGIENSLPGAAPLDEESPLREVLYPYRQFSKEPGDWDDEYEKILVERTVMGQNDLPATILRLPAVYGPGDKQHRVGEYLRRMDKGEEIRLSEAKAKWKWTRGYVENVASAIVLAATNSQTANGLYNVGEKSALTEIEWIRNIGRVAGWKGEVQVVANVEDINDSHDYRFSLEIDTSRIHNEIGYAERVARDDALARSIAWEREAL